jgi:site-specific DNA-methyltransferase (adenine-specific)
LNIIFEHDRAAILHGDCRDLLTVLPENSVDAIVCDPPYLLANASGTGFMGREWDSVKCESGETVGTASERWHRTWAAVALRVLKPGGHMLAFGGSRTFHRMCSAIEDVGFDLRDVLMWGYISGFPKSLDISKQLDKKAGHWRGRAGAVTIQWQPSKGTEYERTDKGEPITAAAAVAAWDGWGTALKPAYEPICLARKPLEGTVAQNVLKWGVGGINIGGCRIGDEVRRNPPAHNKPGDVYGLGIGGGEGDGTTAVGRWPSNVILSHHEECVLTGQVEDEHTMRVGERLGDDSRGLKFGMGKQATTTTTRDVYECHEGCPTSLVEQQCPGVTKSFFCPKPSRAEKELGLDHLPGKSGAEITGREEGSAGIQNPRAGAGSRAGNIKNTHSTVKPVALMRYLCRLITPPGGTVLDIFAGSGTTGVAAIAEGFSFVGVEMGGDDGSHMPILLGRIRHALGLPPEPLLREQNGA